MYSRADLSRIVSIVVALFLTAVSTSAVARGFRAADTQSKDYPTVQALRVGAIDLNRTNVALTEHTMSMAGIYAKAQRDPATAALIERIRKVE